MTTFIIGLIIGWIAHLLYTRYIAPIFTSRIDRIPRTANGKTVKPVEVKRG